MSTRRRRLMLVGLLPALLAAAFAVKVLTMLDANAEGRDAFRRGDHDGAALLFADTGRLNWIERWVAPFDEGAAEHAEGRIDVAIGRYEDALRVVPDREECTVRINLALAHEAVGDELSANGATEDAAAAWQEGIDVLAEGDCPTDSGRGEEQSEQAGEADRRLREKLAQQPPDQQPPPPQQGGEEEPQPAPDPRQDELERNNQRGQDQRREDQELYEDEDYSRPETW